MCFVQDLSREQAETHKVLVQPALEVAANATVVVLQQLIKSITEQVSGYKAAQYWGQISACKPLAIHITATQSAGSNPGL